MRGIVVLLLDGMSGSRIHSSLKAKPSKVYCQVHMMPRAGPDLNKKVFNMAFGLHILYNRDECCPLFFTYNLMMFNGMNLHFQLIKCDTEAPVYDAVVNTNQVISNLISSPSYYVLTSAMLMLFCLKIAKVKQAVFVPSEILLLPWAWMRLNVTPLLLIMAFGKLCWNIALWALNASNI